MKPPDTEHRIAAAAAEKMKRLELLKKLDFWKNKLKTLKVSDDHVKFLGARMIWMILVLLGLSRCHWDAD